MRFGPETMFWKNLDLALLMLQPKTLGKVSYSISEKWATTALNVLHLKPESFALLLHMLACDRAATHTHHDRSGMKDKVLKIPHHGQMEISVLLDNWSRGMVLKLVER
mmetsp:Transcript_12518/g.23501  ORF Transcript_12518/g.23501 Transcript_12518/m.23501 type:complete len:108 (-) Transcript_12518:1273-1596(-)